MEQEERKDGNYSLNTMKDIWKYDPSRMLDLGNVFQVLISQNKPEVDEESRALSNFEKLTEDVPRPISHTLVDASRVAPDIVMLAGPSIVKGIGKALSKGIAKGATKGVAKKLVSEGTSDAAEAFAKSKFFSRDDKVKAAKKWVRDLYENRDAMERIAGRKLKDSEVEAIRKNINEFVPHKIDKYNADVDKMRDIFTKFMDNASEDDFLTPDDFIRYINGNRKLLGLTNTEYENLMKNIGALPSYKKSVSHSHLPLDRVMEKEKIISTDNIKNIGELLLNPGFITSTNISARGADAAINNLAETKYQTNEALEMKPNYWTLGSEPTPVTDFIASIFNVDFDDPARFNKKDIDTFFDFLEDIGTIEPGIKDKWTPRQKVSVMREMLSDRDYGPFIKERWSKSKHNKDLTKYYNGE